MDEHAFPPMGFAVAQLGCSLHMYMPSFVEIGPVVLEKKIFEGFIPYMDMAAIFVM